MGIILDTVKMANLIQDESTFEEGLDTEEEVTNSDRILDEASEEAVGTISPTWVRAREVVKKVRPIPWAFWSLIRSVWGHENPESIVLDSSQFSVVERLVLRAVEDSELVMEPVERKGQYVDSYTALGASTTSSLCFIHAVCKRVAVSLQERVYRAIIDDALLRARLGVILSKASPRVSVGTGLLVGFSGRAGLAIQLASGSETEASDALKGLAMGQDISSTGLNVYGCDPLQVGALALISAGCNKQIASGISAFGISKEDIIFGTPQYDWMLYFQAIEKMRVGKIETLTTAELEYLGIGEEAKSRLQTMSQKAFRAGHNLEWLMLNLSEM